MDFYSAIIFILLKWCEASVLLTSLGHVTAVFISAFIRSRKFQSELIALAVNENKSGLFDDIFLC
jgi:hypothetical protein